MKAATLQDAARFAHDDLAEIFGIKLNRVVGPTKARRIRCFALTHDIDFFVMATGGSMLADTDALLLATDTPDIYILSVCARLDMLTVDSASGRGPRNHDGHLLFPEDLDSACIPTRMHFADLLRSRSEDHPHVASVAAADQPQGISHGRWQAGDLPHYHLIIHVARQTKWRKSCPALAKDAQQVHVKPGADADWQPNVARLRLVREAVGPKSLVYCDLNASTTSHGATRTGGAVASADAKIEQPCETFDVRARAQIAAGKPMKLYQAVHDT